MHTGKNLLAPRRAAAIATVLALAGGGSSGAPKVETADELMIVDCLLPAKVRRLGRRNTYLAPRQPLRTTAVRCRIRGGEYTEPDQANYATALQVWLPQAEAGSSEAQYYVGQIYEKGLGIEPDLARAASWYGRASEQGYSAAQVTLGYLYEEGLGVPRDEVKALNLYRRAAGLAEDLVVLEEADYESLLRLRQELERKVAEVDSLEREVEELRRQLQALEGTADDSRRRQETLESLIERLQGEVEEGRQRIADSEGQITSLEAALAAQGDVSLTAAAGRRAERAELDFGRYFGLVVGNSEYRSLPRLATAADDARRVADLLRQRYGFEVRLLLDATRFDIMSALNELRETLTSDDNLLVYYSGHGERDDNRSVAYWQPVDAAPDNPTNWIPSGVLSDHLDLIAAKHVFVVADSVFSGLRNRSAVARLPRGMNDEERYYHIRHLLERRSRLVLTSGGEQPIASAGGAATSRFSAAFLDTLEENDTILEASKVYETINERLFRSRVPGEDNPVFATMKWARNDVAEFFFVPAEG